MIGSGSMARSAYLAGCAAMALAASSPACAQAMSSDPQASPTGTASHEPASDVGTIADIVVTAQKRGVAEAAQKVPIAITALNSKSIEDMHVRDLASLSSSIPNVSLSSINTRPGFANFEIRGFGINSSIPSVEPAVGVFVDGVYLGQTSGVVLDLFDIDSIEVLRGPQGTLFGRNTTGGAVSIRTRRPGNVFQINGKVDFESGPLYTAGVSVEGPLTDTLRAKIAGYASHDEGYFYDPTVHRSVGKRNTSFIRPTIVYQPTSSFDTTLIYERLSEDGDGAVVTNPAYTSGLHPVSNFPGMSDLQSESVTSETNLRVPFGDGIITNVAGWRRLDNLASEDLDGSPSTFYHVRHALKQHQFSEELRYAGTFGRFDLTIGGYYFQQKYMYIEERTLATLPAPSSLGGLINQHSFAFFGQGQYHLTDSFSFIAGGRFSWEKKEAKVATFNALSSRCAYDLGTCTYNFPGPGFADSGEHVWKRFSPKLGLQWQVRPNIQTYFSYSEGVRSGGYNVRSTSLSISPGPYNEENQKSFELGFKSDLLNHHLRVNGAVFHNTISNLQRDINQPDPLSGTVQITQNAGNARINGAELEVTIAPTKELTFGGNVGYLNGKYTKLLYDLNGALPGLGYELQLARLVPWSYGGYISYSRDVGHDLKFTIRSDYGHRDRTPFTDANTGYINKVDDWSATATLAKVNDSVSLSFYAKNLLNQVWNGAAAPLPPSAGGGLFEPISKGRTFGAELRFRY